MASRRARSTGHRSSRRLPGDAVVVAAHGVEPLGERRPVAVLEGGELLGQAVGGEVALGDHGGERLANVGGEHLGDGRPVHHLRIRRRTRRNTQDRTTLVGSDAAGLGLAEVDVVDGGEPAAQSRRRAAAAS